MIQERRQTPANLKVTVNPGVRPRDTPTGVDLDNTGFLGTTPGFSEEFGGLVSL